MDLELLKKLLKLVDSSGITDFSFEEGDLKIKMSKRSPRIISAPQLPAVQAAPAAAISAADTVVATENTSQDETLSPNLHQIKSPIVGTLYRAPAPDAESFVKVGDTVTAGTVLCIIEAMKLMNEIESDVNGRIVKILVENGKPVEYNQPLFLIEV
ncbi:MAG: acetyl-CoA carboxylase biotin carboxyl carrier protein [Bacteroidota bacterium]